jgi:cadmium resistance protein CadD (predicted permease)
MSMVVRDRTRRAWFGAAVLIAVGIIGLVANFDLVPRQYLEQIWKLWPLIPLAIGLSLLMRSRSYGDDHRDPGGS